MKLLKGFAKKTHKPSKAKEDPFLGLAKLQTDIWRKRKCLKQKMDSIVTGIKRMHTPNINDLKAKQTLERRWRQRNKLSKKWKKMEIQVQRVVNVSHKLLKQEPLFYRTRTKISEINDPLEDIKSLFEPTAESQQEPKNKTSSFKGHCTEDPIKVEVEPVCIQDACKINEKRKNITGGTGEGIFVQQCAISGCKNSCGTSTKSVRTLKGLYEIDDLFASLQDSEISNLKVCNVHYNRDHRRHQQWSGDSLCLAVQTCFACSKTVKTTKSIPCKKHSISLLNNGMSFSSAISCCFFSEHCTQSSKIIENENLYTTGDTESQNSCYLCMSCKQPFVQLAKTRKAYEEQEERIRKLLMDKSTGIESCIKPAIAHNSLLKAHQIKVQDALERVLEASKEEENLIVGIGNNSTLTLSKNIFINGVATSNKKLIINFLKDSIIAKHIVLGQTTTSHYLLQPHKKMSLASLTEEILSQFHNLEVLPICYGIFEEQWVSACEQHNQKNKYQDGKRKYYIDHHNLHHPKLKLKTVCKMVKSFQVDQVLIAP